MMKHPIQGLFPVLPIRNSVIFPGLALPLRVGRRKSIAAVRRAELQAGEAGVPAEGGWLLTLAQDRYGVKEKEGAEVGPSELHRV